MIWNLVSFLCGFFVAILVFAVYDRMVQKEIQKIFAELEEEIEKWKAEALNKDDDAG